MIAAGAQLTEGPIGRWLRFARALELPPVYGFSCRWHGRFRRRPDEKFHRCEAWQRSSLHPIARDFQMKLHMAPLVTMKGHDLYERGHGHMVGTLMGVKVVDAAGPELDTGELVTWLNDAVLLAPSMLLGPHAKLIEAGDTTFEVVLSDRGRTVSATVLVDDRGAPVDFATTDRFVEDPAAPGQMRRARWTTPVDGWTEAAGRPVPTGASAVWHLDAGPFIYMELALDPAGLIYHT